MFLRFQYHPRNKYGINIHNAGASSTQVDKWSAGCQVFSHSADFEEFMRGVNYLEDHWERSSNTTAGELEEGDCDSDTESIDSLAVSIGRGSLFVRLARSSPTKGSD